MSDVKNLSINGTTYAIKGQSVVDTADDSSLKFWTGTDAEYQSLVTSSTVATDTLYYITDDTSSGTIANTDLSNLTPLGQARFASPSLDNINATGQKVMDGQWVGVNIAIASDVAAPTTTDLQYDLSTYIPNDDYQYEVIISVLASTGATSGDIIRVSVSSSVLNSSVIHLCQTRTRSSSAVNCAGNATIPIGANRILSVLRYSSNTGTFYLYLMGYRRIGTNV